MTALIPLAELVVDRVRTHVPHAMFPTVSFANPRRRVSMATPRGKSELVLVEVKGEFQSYALWAERDPRVDVGIAAFCGVLMREKWSRAVELQQLGAPFRRARPAICLECGRWGYHLVTCSRGGPR